MFYTNNAVQMKKAELESHLKKSGVRLYRSTPIVSSHQHSSEWLGVSWHISTNCWQAYVSAPGLACVSIGVFKDEHHAAVEAAAWRRAVERVAL